MELYISDGTILMVKPWSFFPGTSYLITPGFLAPRPSAT